MSPITRTSSMDTSVFIAKDASEFELVEIPSDQVDREMLIAGESSGIPEVLQGLWWMDGNPLPDEVISLGGSPWDAETRTTWIHVYGERIWSWHAGVLGRSLYALVLKSRLVYELHFSHDLRLGAIIPIISLRGRRVRVPGWLTRFTMRFVRDGLWVRESLFFGVFPHRYDLRRIVRGDGTRSDAFEKYVRDAPRRSCIAARRSTNRGQNRLR